MEHEASNRIDGNLIWNICIYCFSTGKENRVSLQFIWIECKPRTFSIRKIIAFIHNKCNLNINIINISSFTQLVECFLYHVSFRNGLQINQLINKLIYIKNKKVESESQLFFYFFIKDYNFLSFKISSLVCIFII